MFSYSELLEKIKKIKIGKQETILKGNDFEIYVLRPTKVFKSYDPNKNFQIFLKLSNGSEFRPNHLIVMIDLNLRVRDNSSAKEQLLTLFDNIFYKKSYVDELQKLRKVPFIHFLYDLEIISTLYVLLLIEQDYNYPAKKSKYIPTNLFLHGWVRQFLCEGKEIDNMVMSVCNRQTPLVKYTREDNMNHKKYNADRKPLWYL